MVSDWMRVLCSLMDVYNKAPEGGLNGSDHIGCAHEQGKWPGLRPVTAEVRAPCMLASEAYTLTRSVAITGIIPLTSFAVVYTKYY